MWSAQSAALASACGCTRGDVSTGLTGPACPQVAIPTCLVMSTSNEVLEQVRLLHDAEELLFVHLAVTIAIRFVDHLLKLLVRHPLPKLLRDALEVLERDFPGLVIIEEPESLEDLVLRVTVENLLRHHCHELRELDGARPIIVDILDHLLDLLFLWLEAESTHRDPH